LRRQVPKGLRDLLRLPAMGPVRVRAIHLKLGVNGIDDLRAALASGRLAKLRGFGPGIRSRLQAAVASKAPAVKRWQWRAAAERAAPLRDYLSSIDGVTRVEVAGSFRRGRDTVGDLDVVIAGRPGLDLPRILRHYGDVTDLPVAGSTRCTVILRSGLQVDLRLVRAGSFGSALQYFTGSRDHSIALRQRAQQRGLKLNEYGLYRGRVRIAGATEQEVYAALDLPWIPPELRENRGEIAAAERGALPALIELPDLRGDLHVHTDASDGRESLEDMVRAARARGLEYIAITDHSRHLGIVHGLDADRLSRQIDAIEQLNSRNAGCVVLKGTEVDILEDGRLALPDGILARLDVVVAAIHDHFDLPEARQTARILRALEHPHVSILAHPTGRLLGERAPCKFDLSKILAAARARPCYLELNSQPSRLDLDDLAAKAAKEQGVLLSIASDAHTGAELGNLSYGVRQGRRAWLTADDVLNARPLSALLDLLVRTHC
jgi:DNA polymerase (family 10)